MTANIISRARSLAGLTQAELAQHSGTSRPTLSAYEHGRKAPTLQTASRIVAAAGFELSIVPRTEFTTVWDERGRPITVPSALPRLPISQALATVELPFHLNWSDKGRRYDLQDRSQRARVYEIVLREGGPGDILRHIDGVLLADLWNDLVLPTAVRAAWQHLIPHLSPESTR